jgi:hypothetical protein
MPYRASRQTCVFTSCRYSAKVQPADAKAKPTTSFLLNVSSDPVAPDAPGVSRTARYPAGVLARVTALRYVTPLREGGSLPGIVEADDLGTYVAKFRGAGQGRKALVAEVIVTELARSLGIRVPDLRLLVLEPAIARYEADEEVQDLLHRSVGLNLGVDFLPGAFGFDASSTPDPSTGAAVLWLDSFVANVDRTWRNPNLLTWHGTLWAIDHGAALYFHHSWPSGIGPAERFATQPYDWSDHVLGRFAAAIPAAHDELSARVDAALVRRLVDLVPAEWLETAPDADDVESVRTAYVDYLLARLASPGSWLPRPVAA